jgi:hypothetical protein
MQHQAASIEESYLPVLSCSPFRFAYSYFLSLSRDDVGELHRDIGPGTLELQAQAPVKPAPQTRVPPLDPLAASLLPTPP